MPSGGGDKSADGLSVWTRVPLGVVPRCVSRVTRRFRDFVARARADPQISLHLRYGPKADKPRQPPGWPDHAGMQTRTESCAASRPLRPKGYRTVDQNWGRKSARGKHVSRQEFRISFVTIRIGHDGDAGLRQIPLPYGNIVVVGVHCHNHSRRCATTEPPGRHDAE